MVSYSYCVGLFWTMVMLFSSRILLLLLLLLSSLAAPLIAFCNKNGSSPSTAPGRPNNAWERILSTNK